MTADAPHFNRRRLSREISAVENRSPDCHDILKQAYRVPEWARVIGVTGPPGAGKSTLVDTLAAHWAEAGERVAVLAVDPSSPFSGGAVLGDRIRMDRSAAYPNIYFRSLSSRGHVGGVSEATADIVAVLSNAGFQRVLIETVGAGQSDIEIVNAADCIVVVMVPGLGDMIQAQKAGIMEIGNVYAINKADLPGARQTMAQVDLALQSSYMGNAGVNVWKLPAGTGFAEDSVSPGVREINRRHGDARTETQTWRPPVLATTAATAEGVGELAGAVDDFLDWAEASGRAPAKRRDRIEQQLIRVLSARLIEPYLAGAGGRSPLAALVDRIVRGETSPIEAAETIVAEGLKS